MCVCVCVCVCTQFQILEDLVPVLEPLVEATELLTKEEEPTAGAVYVLLYELHKDMEPCVASGTARDGEEDSQENVQEEQQESPVARSLKATITEKLQERFHLDESGQPLDKYLDSPLLVATLLDPRYKSLAFLKPQKADKVLEHVKELMDAVLDTGQEAGNGDLGVTVKTEPPDRPPRKKLCERLAGDVVDLTSTSLGVERELMDYRAEPVREPCPLAWWKERQCQFPTLAKLAIKYLAIPPTEVPSERLFSTAGGTISKPRASLDGDTADQLLFINKNMSLGV